MLPGPDSIVECPHCRARERHFTLMSGNTFGAVTWSDGKVVAPMLPSLPLIVQCHACQECYWLGDAEVLGETGYPWDGPSADDLLPEIAEPSEATCYALLDAGFASNPDHERTLRHIAMMLRNDPLRDDPTGPSSAPPTGPARANLEALSRLLSAADPEERLLKAEVLRELGDSAAALGLLALPIPARYDAAVAVLLALCTEGNTRVRILFGDRP